MISHGEYTLARNMHIWKSVAVVSVAALALSACGGSADGEEASGDGGDITIGVFNGWEEGIAASELWKYVLEDQGYTVTLEYADPAPIFSGLASGDYDFNLDVWKPVTHGAYIDEFEDSIEDYGAWNEEASNHLAVNEDAPIDSIDELAENADAFGNMIVGIDPGAGLTQQIENEVIPTYGLESMEYMTSSTPAMLQELDTAIANGDNIVVSLWRPHWAYEAYPIRDLEDPEGTLGVQESLNTYGREGFSEEFPEVAGWLQDFQMDGDTLHSLESDMFFEVETEDYGPIVEEWVAENQEYVDGLTD